MVHGHITRIFHWQIGQIPTIPEEFVEQFVGKDVVLKAIDTNKFFGFGFACGHSMQSNGKK